MNDNVVKFKKKYTLEEEQISFLKQHLNILLEDDHLLQGYMTKPFIGSERWKYIFDASLLAATRAAIEWLILDLTERDVTADENAYNMYSQLIEWFKETEEGYHFAITMYADTGETMQYMFLCVRDRKLALVALYDDTKDMTTGIIQILNNQGMVNLGYSNEV